MYIKIHTLYINKIVVTQNLQLKTIPLGSSYFLKTISHQDGRRDAVLVCYKIEVL